MGYHRDGNYQLAKHWKITIHSYDTIKINLEHVVIIILCFHGHIQKIKSREIDQTNFSPRNQLMINMFSG